MPLNYRRTDLVNDLVRGELVFDIVDHKVIIHLFNI